MKGFNAVLRFLCFIAALVILFTGLATGKAAAAWSTDPTINNAVSTAANEQYSPTIISDGSGGAIITWYDLRNGANNDIYAQRIDTNGALTDPVATSTTPVSERMGHDDIHAACRCWLNVLYEEKGVKPSQN